MKKGILALALLCVLVLLPVSCLGETEFNTILQYMPKVTNISGTNYLLVQMPYYGTYGVITTDGQEIIPCQFNLLESLGSNLFSAAKDLQAVNGKALVDGKGHVCSEYAYASFKVFNQNWAIGYVVDETREATEENKDIKIGKSFYYISRTDLFFVDGEGTASAPVASLPGMGYTSVQAHGKYLSVEDAYGNVIVYNKHYQAMPVMVESIKTPIYTVQFLSLVDTATGDRIGDGFTKVAETSTPTGLLLLVSRSDFEGTLVSGVFDENGNEIIPVEYNISKLTNRYAFLKDGDKQGLYSLELGKLVAPCEFDSIFEAKNALDPYVTNGYIMVTKDDARCYYDIEKGEITCTIPAEYYETMTRVGSVCYVQSEGGFTLIAADGTVTQLEADAIGSTAGDGYLLIAKRGDYFGVVDWHGNEVLPFYHKTAPVISQDSKVIIRVSTGSQVDQIIR